MDLTELEETLTRPDFDVEKYASDLLQSGTDIGRHANDLTEAERELDSQLEEHVSVHHNDLLSQATSVERLETHLSSVSDQSAILVASVERLSSRINEPYESIKTQTATLMRMQKSCDMLRKIIRIVQLSKKLQGQMQGGVSEITKAASSLSELLELWQPEDELTGIEMIEQDQRVMLHARNEVERSADSMLSSGMENKSQNQMGVALQVFFNLSVLPEKIDNISADLLKAVKVKSAELLDARKINAALIEESKSAAGQHQQAKNLPGRSSRAVSSVPTSNNLAAFRLNLWSNIEALLDFVLSKLCEAMQLQKVIAKKRDAALGVVFIELLQESKRNLVENLWKEVIGVLKSNFHQASADSSTVKQTLEGEFPKLIRLFNDFWSRLCHAASNSSSAFHVPDLQVMTLRNPFENSGELNQELRQVFVAFERQYLSRSLSRLFDPVNLMFVAGEAPKMEELEQVFKVINSEVAIAQVDKTLHATVVNNVAKTVKLMCAKCEQLIDGQASQVVGYPTNEQRRNVEIVNCLFSFYIGVEQLMPNNAALKEIDELIKSAIKPLIGSIIDAVEAILLTMHNEDFNNVATFEPASLSPYMKELQAFIARVHVEFLGKFNCKTMVAESCLPLASKSIELFILHASIIRPLSSAGQGKLLQDCDNLETALSPVIGSVSAWDRLALHPYLKQLSAFKSLVTAKPEDIPECPALKEGLLRYSTALHVLFSRAPPEMKTPHESAGWSISRYSAWLEDHPNEKDRLQLIQGALESYVAFTRARKEKSYAYPYNIMLTVLQSANL